MTSKGRLRLKRNKGVKDDSPLNANAWEGYAEEYGSSDDDDSLVVSFQSAFQFVQANEGVYDDTDLLIDTGSTVSVIRCEKMLVNVTDNEKTLRAYTNGGHQDST